MVQIFSERIFFYNTLLKFFAHKMITCSHAFIQLLLSTASDLIYIIFLTFSIAFIYCNEIIFQQTKVIKIFRIPPHLKYRILNLVKKKS
uniref:Uncharacterized protein n=1 Tax=Octopus bimaculoides TaxID=37653 RepID=A0A0L8G5B8_OCTBM